MVKENSFTNAKKTVGFMVGAEAVSTKNQRVAMDLRQALLDAGAGLTGDEYK